MVKLYTLQIKWGMKMNLFAWLRDFLKEPPAIAPIEDKQEVDKAYSHWRMRIFYSCFIGYTVFYL